MQKSYISPFGRGMPKGDYLAGYSTEQRQQIESIAQLILSGENDNVALAASLSVGFDCRRAAWQRAVEIDTLQRLMSQQGRDDVAEGVLLNSPFSTDYNRIADWYLQAFHVVCQQQNIKPSKLRG